MSGITRWNSHIEFPKGEPEQDEDPKAPDDDFFIPNLEKSY